MVKPEFRIYSFPPSESIRLQIPLSEIPCQNCANKNYECYCIAIQENLGENEGYSIKELDSLKSQLDSVRNELDHIDIRVWQAFTRATNVTQDIVYKLRDIPVELATTGWCKLYEILHYFRWHEFMNENEFHSMHLCECPGGFISALNHYIQSNVINKRQRLGSSKLHWEWKANSLNPYFEGNNPNSILTDDIIYRDTYRAWITGVDDTGDITNTRNIDYIWQKTSKNTKNCWLADLVTADGSLDIQFNPNEQEKLTSSIQYCETVCALGILRKHGSFILKCFNVLHHTTISIIALLCYCFQNVHIVKPVMSKGGSGEVYIVAIDFQGIRSVLLKNLISHIQSKKDRFHEFSLFPREWLPEKFIEQCITAATLFTRWQIDNINQNLLKFKSQVMTDSNCRKIKILDSEIQDSTDHYSNDPSYNNGIEHDFNRNVHAHEYGVSKRERRIFALEYIQNLGITSISTNQYILPNLQHRKEYLNSTSLSRKGGDRNRVQGVYIDRKYAFQQYSKLQQLRSDLYSQTIPIVDLVSTIIDPSKESKFLYFVDIQNGKKLEMKRDASSCRFIERIPLKNEFDCQISTSILLPKERVPKRIPPRWFAWSKDDITYQRLVDRLKTQAYMFESENFFKIVDTFHSVSIQISPYCEDDLIQRYCETVTAIDSPIKNMVFGIDTCIHNELYDKEFRWTTITFDSLKSSFENKMISNIHPSISENPELNHQNITVDASIIEDLPLFSQIPANTNILSLFEALRDLKSSELGTDYSMNEYLGKINKYAEIYSGITYFEVLEDYRKFPLTYLLNINSSNSRPGTIILVSDREANMDFRQKPEFNSINEVTFIDISKELKYCNQYKQIINSITEDYNVKKSDYDLIYIDSFSHLVPTFTLGQFETEGNFSLITNIMIALNLIKFGGSIIISLKTVLTRFTGGLIIVLSSVFNRIALSKPYSLSSPCYSGIHLICSGYNDNSNILSRHFFQFLWDISSINNKKSSIVQCVPPTLFASDNFLHWLKEFNSEAIQCDIDLLETVIEHQESSDHCKFKNLECNSENKENDEDISGWNDYPNRIRVQREVLSYILLGQSCFSDAGIKVPGSNSDPSRIQVSHRENINTKKNEDISNSGELQDKELSSHSNKEETSSFESCDNINIDPFADFSNLSQGVDAFCDT
ncbi:ribosomal RNA large subunit methyltransferase J protein [Cryptosporidium felis]|nr:ribosomal RNA large subunit methyltransferase J protein [Cryptosporidium felis]